MIAHLRGYVVSKQPPLLVLDVAGVGYVMQCPMTAFYQLPEMGEVVEVHTHFVVREDAQLLFAFVDEYECRLFQQMIKVNGIGPKIALALLSGIPVAQFRDDILNNDVDALVRVPGIGEKTAQRLIIEMQGVFKKDSYWQSLPGGDGHAVEARRNEEQATQALISLGYKSREAGQLVAKVIETGDYDVSEIVRRALKTSLG